MFYFNEFEAKYELKFLQKKTENTIFNVWIIIMQEILDRVLMRMGKYIISAWDIFSLVLTIQKNFLDDEAIKYYIVNKHHNWLTRGAKKSEIDEFKKTKALNKIKRESFSDKYFEWWCNTEETIFIRIDLVSKYNYAIVYCKNQKVLEQLYKSNISACVFPSL